MRATTTMALAAMLACMQACEDDGKELIPYHNPYGQDALPNDDANLPKEDTGTSDSATEDAQVTDGALPDGDVDAADGDVDAADGEADAADGDMDGGEVDGAMPDGEVIDPVTPPDYAQVAAASEAGKTYFVWAQEKELKLRIYGLDGEFEGEAQVIDTLEFEPTSVQAVTADGVPWVAVGAEGEQILLYQADYWEDTRLTLPLYGEPKIAKAADKLFVAGKNEDGVLSWMLISANDIQTSLRPIIVDDGGLPFPDDVIGIKSAVIMRKAMDGQCVYLDTDANPLGNFPCLSALGMMVSDGETALLSHDQVATSSQYNADGTVTLLTTMSPLFGADSGGHYFIANPESDNAQSLQRVDGYRVTYGRNIRGEDVWNNHMQLYIATVDTLWTSGGWQGIQPWQNDTRLAICDHCVSAGSQCRETPGEGEAVLLRFDEKGETFLTKMPLFQRCWNNANDPYALEIDRTCTPAVEQCDGLDQDCNGEPDNGLCCSNEATENGIDRPFNPGGEVTALAVTDVENGDAYRVAVRVGEHTWPFYVLYFNGEIPMTPFTQLVNKDEPNTSEVENFVIRDATDLLGVQATGGTTAFVGYDTEGQLSVWWAHRTRKLKDKVRIDCNKLLAFDTTATHGDQESLLIVCSDKILRYYAEATVEDESYTPGIFANGLDVRWATLTRTADGVLSVLVGYKSSAGNWKLALYTYTASSRRFMESTVVYNSLKDLSTEDDFKDPIQLHQIMGRAPVQLREGKNARLRINTPYGYKWQEIVTTPNPSQVRYAVPTYKVVTSGPYEYGGKTGTGFWVTNVKGEGSHYNLWTTEPTFVWDGPEPMWAVNRGRLSASTEAQDVAVYVVPDEEDPDIWHMITRQTTCR